MYEKNPFLGEFFAFLKDSKRGIDMVRGARASLEREEADLVVQIERESDIRLGKALREKLSEVQRSLLEELQKEREYLVENGANFGEIDEQIQKRAGKGIPFQPRADIGAPTDIIGREVVGLQARLQGELDLTKRREFQQELNELEALRQPITTDQDMEGRMDQLRSLNTYINSLETGLPSNDRIEVGNQRRGFREELGAIVGKNLVLNAREEIPEDYERERARTLEIRQYQIGHLQDYLRKKKEALYAEAQKFLKNLDSEERGEAERRFEKTGDAMERQFMDPEARTDPKTYRTLLRDFVTIQRNIHDMGKDLYESVAHGDEQAAEARKSIIALRQELGAITPETLNFLEASLGNPSQKARRAAILTGVSVPDHPPRHTELAREAIQKLRDGSAQRSLDEFEALLADPAALTRLQRLELTNGLAQLKKTFDAVGSFEERVSGAWKDPEFEKNIRYQKVQGLVHVLKNSQTSPDEFLKDPFFKDHVERLPFKKFNDDYSQYTNGGMVFYTKGHVWKIIIRKPKDGEEESRTQEESRAFRTDLTHEMRHLEFDSMPEQQRREYIALVLGHKKWPEVRDRFMAEIGAIKKPHTAGKDATEPYTWPDGEIISELYAMQDMPVGKNTKHRDLLTAFSAIGGIEVFNPSDTRTAEEIIADSEKASIAGAVAAGEDEEEEEKETGAKETDEGTSSAKEFGQKLERLKEALYGASHSPFAGGIPGIGALISTMITYLEETEKINEEYDEHPSNKALGKTVGSRIGLLEKHAFGTVMKELESASSASDKGILNPFAALWLKTSFLCVEDILQVGRDFFEFTERRFKRRKADHAAKLGSALFAGTSMGQESKARMQKAEQEEVNEWKGRYENMDAWDLEKQIVSMAENPLPPEKDELKAILRILADKGRINWSKPELWKVLNRLQNKVFLDPNDTSMALSPNLLRTKLHKALGEIWDYDEYTTLERTNESHYESHKKEYQESYKKLASVLTGRMEELYKKHVAGGKVDPAEYEAAIEFAILNGKSYAEAAMFYLMVGTASGLLEEDRALALDDTYLNNWPASQWFYNKRPPLTREDYKRTCQQQFGEDYKDGKCRGEFKNFYWTQVLNDSMVTQRVRKAVIMRKWDHDWARTISCMGDANTMKQFLSGKSGEQAREDTAVENTIVGTLQYMEENARDPDATNFRANFTRHMASMAMMEGILGNVAYRDTQIYKRMNNSILNATAREASETNHGDWNVQKNLERIRAFQDMIDAPFFQMIRDTRSATSDPDALVQRICGYLDSHYNNFATNNGLLNSKEKGFANLNTIFDNMDKITATIMGGKTNTELLRILEVFNEGTPEISQKTVTFMETATQDKK